MRQPAAGLLTAKKRETSGFLRWLLLAIHFLLRGFLYGNTRRLLSVKDFSLSGSISLLQIMRRSSVGQNTPPSRAGGRMWCRLSQTCTSCARYAIRANFRGPLSYGPPTQRQKIATTPPLNISRRTSITLLLQGFIPSGAISTTIAPRFLSDHLSLV